MSKEENKIMSCKYKRAWMNLKTMVVYGWVPSYREFSGKGIKATDILKEIKRLEIEYNIQADS